MRQYENILGDLLCMSESQQNKEKAQMLYIEYCKSMNAVILFYE